MAWPISLLYGLIVYCRNLLYDAQLLKSARFSTPTICVGNLSVGGTGKTPMIEYLIRQLQSHYKIAVLSRGYKRKSQGFQLGDENASVEVLGDEPFQLFAKFPSIPIAVDANRRNGITQLEANVKPELVLLDDAFQHRKVAPTISVLLTTYSNPFTKDWYLPTGSLRDAKMASKRADVIVVTKCPRNITETEQETLKKSLQKGTNQPVVFSSLHYGEKLLGSKGEMFVQDLKKTPFTLVTGIANPAPLVHFLKDQHFQFSHLEFPDHHQFSTRELEKIQNSGLVITTEKDFVRLQGKVAELYYLPVAHVFLGEGEKVFLEVLQDALTPYFPHSF